MHRLIAVLHRIRRWVLARICLAVLPWTVAGRASTLKVFALRRIVLPGVAARREDVEHEVHPGVVFRGNTADFLPMVVRVFGRWEPAMTAFLTNRLVPGRVFVDVGANIGWFDLVAAPLVGTDGSVVAIEASPAIHRRLTDQLGRNGLTNVRTVNEAVGSSPGWVHIVDGPSWNSAQSSVVADVERRPGSVACRTLDEILTPAEIGACRVVKIDVEGAEFEVVRGLGPLLDTLPDDAELVVEVGPGRAGSSDSVHDLWDTFVSRGYHAYELPNEYTARFLRDPVVPGTLRRLAAPPDQQTDVVFSRTESAELPL
jgi:FkbM family methyltransferase